MKIIQTKKFILSRGNAPNGDYQTQQGVWGPDGVYSREGPSGQIDLFKEKSDSEDDIKKRWRKKKKNTFKFKRPYQVDGVPGSTL